MSCLTFTKSYYTLIELLNQKEWFTFDKIILDAYETESPEHGTMATSDMIIDMISPRVGMKYLRKILHSWKQYAQSYPKK